MKIFKIVTLVFLLISCTSDNDIYLDSTLKDLQTDVTNYDFLYSKIKKSKSDNINLSNNSLENLLNSCEFYKGEGVPKIFITESGNTIFFHSKDTSKIEIIWEKPTEKNKPVLKFIEEIYFKEK